MTKSPIHEPEIKNENGHYLIYVNGVFKESCDAGELSQVLREIRNSHN